jgi:hypothetical protein
VSSRPQRRRTGSARAEEVRTLPVAADSRSMTDWWVWLAVSLTWLLALLLLMVLCG